MKTFNEFCAQWDVTGHERKLLRIYLVALRIMSTLRATLPLAALLLCGCGCQTERGFDL